jgi:hypothetical protein
MSKKVARNNVMSRFNEAKAKRGALVLRMRPA